MYHLNSLLQSHIFRQLFPKFSKVKLWSLKFFSSEWATVLYFTASPLGASLGHRFRVDYHFNICNIIWIMEPPSSEAESCPSSTLMFRSSSSLQAGTSQESRELAGVPTGIQFVPGLRWPTSMEVVENRSKGRRRCRISWSPFFKGRVSSLPRLSVCHLCC